MKRTTYFSLANGYKLLAIVIFQFIFFQSFSNTLVSKNSTWKYNDSGSNLGTSWRSVGYNDSGWSNGTGDLGFSNGNNTTINNHGGLTYYFRKTFTIADVSLYADFLLELMRDDGAVIYVNGNEVWRDNMPSGNIYYNTTASSTVGGSDESTYFTNTISGNFVTGTNVIAVEIHQRSTSSSDVSFDLAVTGNVPPAATYISFGASWKYLDNGSNQGTGWRASGFNDGSWSSGNAELGYGDGDENTTVSYGGNSSNKHITTYFRKSFSATGFSPTEYFKLSLIRDDGAVVYLNGSEIWRVNMPSGSINYNTLAAANVSGGNESTAQELLIAASSFINGTNVFAVEIHQDDPGSSDISFDLELINIGTPTIDLERGPYLQTLTENSVRIKWRTNVPTNSVVNYGAASNNLNNTVTDPVLTTEHEVTLTGLSADTKYFYDIGNTGNVLAGGDADYFIITAPVSNSTDLIRAWVLGDAGTANGDQRAVRDAYYNYVGSGKTDMILMLGDNAYNDGTDAQYQAAMFENMYEDILRQTVTWSCPGNHDLYSANSSTQTGPYYDIFSFPTAGEAGGLASGTEAYYSWDYGQTHFISLDSDDSPRNTGGSMLTWLTNDLASTTKKWIVVIFHHPPYTKGSHDSDNNSDSGGRMRDMRENVLPILESYGVDLVLSGHSHSYERSYFLNGHYDVSSTLNNSMKVDGGSGKADVDCSYQKTTSGPNAGNGAVYMTAGSSGKITGTLTHHPAMYAYLYQRGSVVVEIENNRMDVKFVNDNGNITDYFSIDKDIRNSAIDTTITSGSSIDLIASWQDDFSWSPGAATTQSITVSPTVNTQYIVKNANGCLADTFNITVITANNPPNVVADAASTINESISIDVLANDSDPDLDPVSISSISSAPNNGGSALINNNGTPGNPYDDFIDYTPSGVYFGVEQFEYTACDDQSPAKCDVAIVSVTVTQNAAPIAVSDAISTQYNVSTTVDVLDNDSDPNEQNLTITAITSAPNHGGSAIINNNGTPTNPRDDYIDFTPSGAYIGVETFTYQVCDNGNPNLCATANVNVTITTCVDETTTLSSPEFPFGAQWKYEDSGTDLGTAWRANSFIDDCWSYGEGQLGFGDAPTTLLNDVNQTTFYFRKDVNINDTSIIKQLNIDLIRDDGAVVYINGTEVYRTNMPGGAINASTLASSNISGSSETTIHSFNIPVANLQNGNNTIAVEVHQDNPFSSDVRFDMRSTIVVKDAVDWAFDNISGTIFLDLDFNRSLSGTDLGSGAIVVESYQDINEDGILDDNDALVGSYLTNTDGSYDIKVYPPNITSVNSKPNAGSDDAFENNTNGNITLGATEYNSLDVSGSEIELFDSLATWKYYDTGLPTGNWKSTTYDDDSWAIGNGSLGFGAMSENTTLTSGQNAYYFRKEVNISNPNGPNYGAALAQVRFDDGIVIYINGVEVLRRNMPNQTINHNTLSEARVMAQDEIIYANINIANPGFVTGSNIIAVEVHQYEQGSSDLVFDMRLAAFDTDVDEIGIRFPNVQVPQGAYIVDAFLKMKASEASQDIVSINVEGEAIDNSPTFTTANGNISNRTRTTNNVDWTSDFSIINNRDVKIDGLNDIIQEIVNRPSWSSGNAMSLFVKGFTNKFHSKEGNNEPELVVAYMDTSKSTIQYIIHVNEESLPSEYIFMTDKNPVVTLSEVARPQANVNIGYLGATSICVAAADDDFDALHIINRFNGTNKEIGGFNGATEIEALALSQNSDSLFAVAQDSFGLIDLMSGTFVSYGNVIGTGDGSIGSQAFNDIDGLAYDLDNNVLWATHRRGGGNDLLFAIDHTTGTFIPDMFGAGVDYIIPSGAGLLPDLDDIAVNPNTGNLFAMTNNGGLITNMIEIDASTGATSLINSTGINDMEGQGFHRDGTFYSTSGRIGTPSNVFFEVDTSNASVTEIGYFSSNGDFEGCDCNSGPYLSVLEGTVFEDMNVDGIFNSGDVVDPGVTVYLYEDLDSDSLITIADLLVDSIQTDADGAFFFAVNRKGVFLVNMRYADLPVSVILTTPDIQDARFNANGNFDFGNDFGYMRNLLPVELSSFYGEHRDGINQLYWTTSSEINNSHFNVLRSNDAIQFEKIGRVEGNGNSNEINQYNFDDRTPLIGENYYKLEQVDFDESKDYSKTILLFNSKDGNVLSLELWPNPAQNVVNLKGLMAFDNSHARIIVSDIFGKIRIQKDLIIDSDNLSIMLDDLNAGYYLVEIQLENQSKSIPFIKQ